MTAAPARGARGLGNMALGLLAGAMVILSPVVRASPSYLIVLTDGTRVEAAAPYEPRGSFAVFRTSAGKLTSVPIERIDVEATRAANGPGDSRATEEASPTPIVLTMDPPDTAAALADRQGLPPPAAPAPAPVDRVEKASGPSSWLARYSRSEMTPALARLLLAFAGLFVCFRGYSAFHFGLGVTAFLVGAYAAATQYALLPADPSWLALATIGATGLILALLVLALYRVGVFLLGAIAGVLAALALAPFLPIDPAARALVLLGAAIAGGLLSSLVERLALTVVTAVVGGLMIASAIFRPGGALSIGSHIPDVNALPADRIFLGSWALLAVLGLAVQFGLPRRRGLSGGSSRA